MSDPSRPDPPVKSTNGGVRFKAFLWAGAAFLASFIEKVAEKLNHDTWPSRPMFTLGCLAGALQVFIVLRSFYDGSAQRHEDAKKADDKKKEDTQFFGKPAP